MAKKYAVFGDGTGPHEHFIVTVVAESEIDALDKVAQMLINDPDDAAAEQSEVDNHYSPTYSCEVYNDEGGLVYNLKTSPLTEL